MKAPTTLSRPSRLALATAGLATLTVAATLAAPTPADARGRTATYEVTVTNLTDGQPFTPPVWATHRPSVEVFEVGHPASDGIRQIAENGNNTPLVSALVDSRRVAASGVAVREGEGPPPILAGESRTFTIETIRPGTRLSMAAMLICTNDGFTGIDSLRLPRTVGATTTTGTAGYDAGTEANTEDFADIVPPCGPLTGVDSAGQGTGSSNPDLVTDGVITHHAGVTGSADLLPNLHGWDVDAPVAGVEVTRVA